MSTYSTYLLKICVVLVSRYFGTPTVKRRLTRRKDGTLEASNGQNVLKDSHFNQICFYLIIF